VDEDGGVDLAAFDAREDQGRERRVVGRAGKLHPITGWQWNLFLFQSDRRIFSR
jgi:hypothetical protein